MADLVFNGGQEDKKEVLESRLWTLGNCMITVSKTAGDGNEYLQAINQIKALYGDSNE